MTTDIQLPGFDYAQLDAETRIVVQQRTTEIRDLTRRTAQDIIDIGRKLIEVKQRLGHGQFGAWLEAEFAWTDRTAQRFMQVAERFGENRHIVEFAPSALYLLAAPSVPDEAREEVLRRAEQGEAITHKAAKQIVEAASPIPDWIAVRDLETRILALLNAREGGLRYDELRDQLAVSTPQDKTNLRTALDALLGSQRIVKKGAVYSVPEPPTETSQDAAKLLRLLGEMGETTFKPLRDRAGLENSRFWRAFNLLEADGKIVRHPSKTGQFPTVSLAPAPAGEPAPGETAQDAQEPGAASPAPAPETSAKDERTAITEAVLEVFAEASAPLTYQEVWRAVDEALGHEVNAGLLSGVMHDLVGERRIKPSAGGRYKLPEAKPVETPAPETPVPDAPPEPAPVTDRAAILQRDRAQAAAAEAQNGAAWQTAQTRARLEAALCDVVDGLSAASQVRGIRSFAEVFSAEDMVATRNLIVSALAAFDKTRPHLEDLVGKLDTMIETGKPYED